MARARSIVGWVWQTNRKKALIKFIPTNGSASRIITEKSGIDKDI